VLLILTVLAPILPAFCGIGGLLGLLIAASARYRFYSRESLFLTEGLAFIFGMSAFLLNFAVGSFYGLGNEKNHEVASNSTVARVETAPSTAAANGNTLVTPEPEPEPEPQPDVVLVPEDARSLDNVTGLYVKADEKWYRVDAKYKIGTKWRIKYLEGPFAGREVDRSEIYIDRNRLAELQNSNP
jgi:hypothetical protein